MVSFRILPEFLPVLDRIICMSFNRNYERFPSREHLQQSYSNLDEKSQRAPNSSCFRNEENLHCRRLETPRRNFHYREFNQGHETEGIEFQYRSLSDQRVQVNESKVRRGNVHYKRNFRSRNSSRGRNKFRSMENCNDPVNEDVSDSESISSTQSFHSNYSDKSDSRSSRYYKKHNFNESGSRTSTYNLGDRKGKYPGKEVNLGNVTASRRNSLSGITEELSVFLSTKRDLRSISKNLQPSDIMMHYRQQVENLSKECIAMNFKKIEKIKYIMNNGKDNSEILKSHLSNLIQQQKEFEDYISSIKIQFSSIYNPDIEVIIKNADSIEMDVQRECKLFKRSLPGYGLKGSILRGVKESQVTIITADNSYYLNVVVPLFIIRTFPEHFLICCEPSLVLKESLEKNVLSLLNLEKNISDENFINNIAFMTEKELLDYFCDKQHTSKKLFVILNLPLKRSIIADLVLANVFDMLKKSVILIVLLSPSADIQIFDNYFSQMATVSLLQTPCLRLPVKTIWKKISSYPIDDYVDQ
ncbi:hypothetical protein X975_00159, partial [Stegodyphus mimosarum]